MTADFPAYHVTPTPGRAGYARPGPGEIVRHLDAQGHPTDNWRLRCPFCGSRMSAYSPQEGPPEAPTFTQVLRCGCTARCGHYFRITAGRVVEVSAPSRAGAEIMSRAQALPGVLGRPRVPRDDGRTP